MELDQEIRKSLQKDGFAVIKGFLSEGEIKSLKEATNRLVEKCCQDMPLSVFSGINSQQSKDQYFAESGDKIRGFLEESAVDSSGKLLVPKEKGLNKIAHALHTLDPTFESITFSDKVKAVLRSATSMDEPTVIQSMVIFKHPQVGGIVRPHQDGSYLITEPIEGCVLGFWIALDEADLENGCLYFVPGSHKTCPLQERFVRNPDTSSDQIFIYRGNNISPIPSEKLVPAACKPGDLVLIDGLVIHQSAPNTSSKPRMAYTFHVYDGRATWSHENWLQPTAKGNFVKIQM